MSRFPVENEIQQIINLLVYQYQIPHKLLLKLIGQDKLKRLDSILVNLGGNTLNSEQLARMFVIERGADLLSGSKEEIRELRMFLLKQLAEDELQELYHRNPVSGRSITSVNHMPRVLAEKVWKPGKRWARDFVRTLNIPMVFAGIANQSSADIHEIIDVEPRKIVPPLVEYQQKLKDRMLEVLNKEKEKMRCIVTLPTGGGKTRIAVESFIEWMQPRFAEGKYLIWIAQGEELCEQAIACIADMWQEREFTESLRIYRYFDGKHINFDDLIGGAVIASIQQINARLKSGDEAFTEMLANCGAMIIDEAHHAVAESYNNLIREAKRIAGEGLFPICGLTATPGRSQEQTMNLVNQFEAYLVHPELPNEEKYQKDPLLYFREEGYLAKPQFILYNTDKKIEANDSMLEEASGELNKEFLRVLAQDEERNLKIIDQLLNVPEDASVLVYACTVEHAEFLSSIMNSMGYKSAYVSADTPKTLRRMYISAFKSKEIQFLFNYGVLTTGFDAPKIDHLFICRPTTSVVLYEQMVGRGLRGPRFGGTATCKVFDFSSNIICHGKPLAYVRFLEEWGSDFKETVAYQ